MKKIKILIVSAEVWRDDTNGGNVLSNLFSGFPADFAQVYFNEGVPDNKLCEKYYQITDKMVINNMFNSKDIGKCFKLNRITTSNNIVVKRNILLKYFRSLLCLIRELLWCTVNWNKQVKLKKFIEDFEPDVIFAPCYGSLYMNTFTQYLTKNYDLKIISYISDDHLSVNIKNINVFSTIYRILLRRKIKNVVNNYSLLYTMTDEQLEQMSKVYDGPIKILKKGVDISNLQEKKKVNDPIKIIYAGSLYCNRFKTLVLLSKALQEINRAGVKFILEIYTKDYLNEKIYRILNDKKSTFIYSSVTKEVLFQKYHDSDIALHVESFDKKYREITKLSFSTKIVDCLQSGCAPMVISWDKHAGYTYLNKNKLAFCISNKDNIKETLYYIVNNRDEIKNLANRVMLFSKERLDINKIHKELVEDFKANV